ncbi:Homeobox, conserved site-containing protein [Artemisia annua]|uniref:Homeobox, conserved site-containing protein n=1 Tax=Artemisia annua TaxID=35608 RepID=A0A2U1M5H3_ARTAN|nr:Homeobox, conserved site-containing protein [Artemisia annua]
MTNKYEKDMYLLRCAHEEQQSDKLQRSSNRGVVKRRNEVPRWTGEASGEPTPSPLKVILIYYENYANTGLAMSMEDYMGQIRDNNNTSGGGGDGGSSSSFLYGSGVNLYGRSEGGFQYPVVKIESGGGGGSQKFHDYPMTIFQNEDEALKAKIVSHPHYSNLLQAYMDCQKVGAPPEIAGRLTAVRQEYEARQQQRAAAAAANLRDNDVYKDPELDQFMEAYYDMLIKYKEELTRPIQEAMEFMRRIESQLSTLTISSSTSAATDHDHPRIFVSPVGAKLLTLRTMMDCLDLAWKLRDNPSMISSVFMVLSKVARKELRMLKMAACDAGALENLELEAQLIEARSIIQEQGLAMSMEDYMGQIRDNNNTSGGGGDGGSSSSFLYGSGVNLYGRSEGGFQYPVVKIESGGGGGSQKFHDYPMTIFQNEDEALKAKIISHPHYSNLLQAYMDCQKVGAPPEIAGRLTAVRQEYEARQQQRAAAAAANLRDNDVYKDPELDQFMEAYYDMLIKYKEELTRPIQEAMEFMRRIESQLSTLTISSSTSAATDHDHPRIFVSPVGAKVLFLIFTINLSRYFCFLCSSTTFREYVQMSSHVVRTSSSKKKKPGTVKSSYYLTVLQFIGLVSCRQLIIN